MPASQIPKAGPDYAAFRVSKHLGCNKSAQHLLGSSPFIYAVPDTWTEIWVQNVHMPHISLPVSPAHRLLFPKEPPSCLPLLSSAWCPPFRAAGCPYEWVPHSSTGRQAIPTGSERQKCGQRAMLARRSSSWHLGP